MKYYLKIIVALMIITGASLITSESYAAPKYKITDIGTLGGSYPWGAYSIAGGINNLGQVVGRSLNSEGYVRGFIWTDDEGIRDLGTLGGLGSEANAINDFGFVTGSSCNNIDCDIEAAFLWTAQDGMKNITTIIGHFFYGMDINNRGHVVGQGDNNGPSISFLWTPEEGMVDIGVLAPPHYNEVARGINEFGQVVGRSHAVTSHDPRGTIYYSHAYLWSEEGGMRDLGTLGGEESEAMDINELGQVVGYSEVDPNINTNTDNTHPFIWESGTMRDLGTLGGDIAIANAINNAGTVVGFSTVSNPNGDRHAFIWTPDIGIQDLNELIPNDSGWELVDAFDINDSGQIVGFGSIDINGDGIFDERAFLLTPLEPNISISPISHDFGSVNLGSSSAPQTFTISNTGTANLHISGMSLSDTANYSLNANGDSSPCGSTTPTITPNSSCTVTVTFSPSSTGTKNANLTINSDDPDTPTLDVSLSGKGVSFVTLVQPNGGEAIPSGSTYTVEWSATPDAVKFDLLYSMNNGTSWKSIVNKVTGNSYNWTVPKPLVNKKNCLVKVTGYNASDVLLGQDTSDTNFTIEVVKVTLPNGGDLWKAGTTHAITWTTNGTKRPVKKVKLFYTYNGGTNWILIYTILKDNPGTYSWRVPVASSGSCKVKVVLKDKLGKTIGTDVSDGFFGIQP